jgi:hypothetical protein
MPIKQDNWSSTVIAPVCTVNNEHTVEHAASDEGQSEM